MARGNIIIAFFFLSRILKKKKSIIINIIHWTEKASMRFITLLSVDGVSIIYNIIRIFFLLDI